MMKRTMIAILCFMLSLSLVQNTFPAAALAASNVTITKLCAVPNPTGLELGFWEVYSKQNVTLEHFGKRPVSRVDFQNWDTIETSPGVYAFDTIFNNYKKAHNYGETIFGCINISFTNQITKGKQTIPTFYENSITNPATRKAAKAFLRAYVQEALKQVGSLVLTIDYEIMSNYKLTAPKSEARAAQWGAWYVEAAKVARQAATDLGKADSLKLQPIVNGNPFEPGNPIALGPTHNQWLIDVVGASDYLAIDTYHSDPDLEVSDPKRTFDIIKFWIDNYSNGLDVIVTENGFTTITEIDKEITREDRNNKTTGTEAQQAEYYKRLFAQLGPANMPDGIFKNKLRSFNIWSITDNKAKPVGNEDRYFGLIRDDNTPKPALAVVRQGFSALERDLFHRPYTVDSLAGTDVTTPLLSGRDTVSLHYNSGDNFDFLRYIDTNLGTSDNYNLVIKTVNKGNVIVCVNNEKWLFGEDNTSFDFDIKKYCSPNAKNMIDIYCTGSVFPFTQQVSTVNISNGDTQTTDAWYEYILLLLEKCKGIKAYYSN